MIRNIFLIALLLIVGQFLLAGCAANIVNGPAAQPEILPATNKVVLDAGDGGLFSFMPIGIWKGFYCPDPGCLVGYGYWHSGRIFRGEKVGCPSWAQLVYSTGYYNGRSTGVTSFPGYLRADTCTVEPGWF